MHIQVPADLTVVNDGGLRESVGNAAEEVIPRPRRSRNGGLLKRSEAFYNALSSAAVDEMHQRVEPSTPRPMRVKVASPVALGDRRSTQSREMNPETTSQDLFVDLKLEDSQPMRRASSPPIALVTWVSRNKYVFSTDANVAGRESPPVDAVAATQTRRASSPSNPGRRSLVDIPLFGLGFKRLAATETSLQPKKQVQFDLDKPKVKGLSLRPVYLLDDDIEKLWWSKQELRSIRDREKVTASRFLARSPGFHLAVEQLILQCLGSETEHRLTNESAGPVGFYSYDDALRITVDHEERGLEGIMIKALKLASCHDYINCRESNLARVMETQTMLKSLPFCSADEQSAMIALNLSQVSSVAANFSRVLAEGDARIVSNGFEEATESPATNSTSAYTRALLSNFSLNGRCLL